MKKIIALALTVAVLCCVPSFVLADVGYTTTVPLFDYDFETAQTGNGVASSIAGSGHVDMAGPDGLDDTNTVLNVPSTSFDIASGLSSYSGTLVFDVDYYFSVFNTGYTVLYLRGDAAKGVISMGSDGTISLCGNKVQMDDSNMVLSEEGWYNIYAEFDFISGKALLTVSGTMDDEPFSATIEDVTMYAELTYTSVVRLLRDASKCGDNLYIDNAKAYYKAPNFLMSAEGIDSDGNGLGADGVLYDGGKIEVSFTEPMSAETVVDANFTLTNEFGRTIPFTGTFNATDNVYVITPSEDLSPRSEYTVSAVNLKTALGANADSDEGVVVKTIGAPFSISAVSDGVVSSGNVTYTVSVQNTGDAAGYVVAVSYDGDKMNSVGLTPVTVADDYDVTLATGGDRTAFYLMTDDGTFKLLDIFSE